MIPVNIPVRMLNTGGAPDKNGPCHPVLMDREDCRHWEREDG